MNFLRKVWRCGLGYYNDFKRRKLRKRAQKQEDKRRENIRQDIIKLYRNDEDNEKREIAQYLEKNKISVFNYSYMDKYKDYSKVEAGYDKEADLWYVLHNCKRLYFPRRYKEKDAKHLYYQLCAEQDERSPHKYLEKEFEEIVHGIIVEVGAAEGMFSLDCVDYADKIYLFECDEAWIEALSNTFRKYKTKVCIVKKYVSDVTNEETNEITLDDFFDGDVNVNLIKMDAEGGEEKILKGALKTINSSEDLYITVTVYHNMDDETKVKKILTGFEITHANGYMVFVHDKNLEKPYLRRGVIRAYKRRR